MIHNANFLNKLWDNELLLIFKPEWAWTMLFSIIDRCLSSLLGYIMSFVKDHLHLHFLFWVIRFILVAKRTSYGYGNLILNYNLMKCRSLLMLVSTWSDLGVLILAPRLALLQWYHIRKQKWNYFLLMILLISLILYVLSLLADTRVGSCPSTDSVRESCCSCSCYISG